VLDYETAQGVKKLPLAEYLDKLIIDTVHRMFAPHNLIFPLFIWTTYMPQDFRYKRNIQRFRDELQRMIDERRSGQQSSLLKDDLLSILISEEFFKGNDNLIIDEIVTFFLAGMKTI
jgi:cytochrome P450